MSGFLADTLLWTGALLALVLLIRRTVASHLGPGAAYALWALPMGRLLLPPLVLPAWLAPAPDPAVLSAAPLEAPLALGESAGMAPVAAAATPDWTALLLAVWLAGAAVFLIRRYALYFRMRRELLARARPVGEAGRIRLVETPDADGPVAFGVIDKVIALPPGFMASRERTARDLALAHELAHHRGHDLICNMLVQPLFALHWFNPLSTLGWRALRRDQEAACDARVVAHCPREARAAYAAVIARFATQRPHRAARLALAAPMACPVLGDRSIVQRLKSLSMTDISTRRRWSGRLLIAASVLALPLTGSISYAQDDTVADVAPPAPPASVAAAPAAPEAPEAPAAIEGSHPRIVRIERRVTHDGNGENGEHARVERRMVRHGDMAMRPEDRAEFERDMKQYREDMAEHARDMAEMNREMAAEQAEIRRKLSTDQAEIRREVRIAVAEAARAGSRAHAAALAAAPRVTVTCRQGQRDVAETVTASDGRQTIFVCNSIAMAESRRAIASARAEIARTRELTSSQRAEALRSLDEAERQMRAD